MLLTALLLGLISSLHCIAMCGPIAVMLPLDRQDPEKKALQLIVYHLGRLTSYASLGVVFGLLGRGLYIAGLQQRLSILAGVVILAMVLLPKKGWAAYNPSLPGFRLLSKIKSHLGSWIKRKSFPSFFMIGLLNGLLPCAMVYSALFGALAMQDVAMGSAFMAVFGLGTVPMMAGVNYASGFLTLPFRNRIQRLIPYATVVVGLLFILRGLSLDIAHLSPSALHLFVQPGNHCR